MKHSLSGALLLWYSLAASSMTFEGPAQLWLPDLVSTAHSEVRITFSPDGQRMLWGVIGSPQNTGGWDIFESRRAETGWSPPVPAELNSEANDFDPSYAPDGSGVYFFSNRRGGFGKDDIYFAALDPLTGRYRPAVNLGAAINTPGDEWAPVLSPDGRQLLFATDGRGGAGKHELFVSERDGTQWRPPVNLAALNSPVEDFDAAFLDDGRSIVFSRGDLDGPVALYVSEFRDGQLQRPVRLPDTVNSVEKDVWTFGPSISAHDPQALYFTSRHAEHRGRVDIYRIKYRFADASAPCDLAATTAPSDDRCAQQWLDEKLHVNDVLSFGTHNSYKQVIPEPEYAILRTRAKDGAAGLDYSHRPLREQLDDGARQLELDVYYDPKGGRFANPALPRLIGKQLDARETAALSQPGFKVMHVPDVDFRSSCVAFVECLRSVKAWSDAHPRHIPLLILINAKDDPSPAQDGAAVLKFDTAAFDALDAEIASVFARDDLITPDQVQGKHATLREAVLAGSWPKLRAARGKIMFALDDNPRKVAAYRAQRRSLEGRLMFVNTDESSPAAAYLTLNEPMADAQRIRAAVIAGFIVRTRADADTVEARSGSVIRRDTALASGAQYISTDYMRPDPRFSTYSARLPGGATAICNPVRTDKRCGKHAIAE